MYLNWSPEHYYHHQGFTDVEDSKTFKHTLTRDGDDGELVADSFLCSKASSVCRHPGTLLPVDEIQGQKCLCCLIGSNSIALSDGNCFR